MHEETTKTSDNIIVSVSEDRMSALLDVNAIDTDEEMLVAKIQDRMSELKITAPFDRKALQEKISENGGTSEKISGLIIARGNPLTPSVDGHIKWVRDFFSKDWLVVNATGRVDYRERSTSRVLKSGDLAGNMVSPKSGSEGQDVFGKPAIPAKPKPNPYRCGKNVRLDEETGSIYATMDGMLRVTNNTVEIDEVYELDEVGLESGNVHFTGAVVVRNDVGDLFTIQAEGTVDVGGTIGAAQIEAGGDVIVRRGISGAGKGKVVSKGTVSAAYILNTDIEAEENVEAHKEITQCNVRCRGSVNVGGGRIVGGEIVAQGGIEVSQAGSEGNVKTLLVAGEDYKLPDILKSKRAELGKLRGASKKIHDNIDPMMEKIRLLSAKQREAVTELMARASEMDMKIDAIDKEIEGVTGESQKRAGNRIRILRLLNPGVTLRILGVSRHITKEYKGPLTAKLDVEKNIITF